MFKFLSNQQSRVLGVDISSTAVKVLELSSHNNKYCVESYAVAPLPLNAIVENDIKDINAVTEALKAAVDRSGSNLKNVATSVSSASVITKIIQLDGQLEGLELEAQVELEAGRFIPYALEEVALDFEVLGINAINPEKIDVLVVASREENVEVRANVIRAAGLIPSVVDVEAYTVERACPLIAEQLPEHGLNKVIAIIDVGAVITTITVLKDMKIIYTREEIFGGQQLTKAIQRRYGLSYEQAGMAKKQGRVSDDYDAELLDPFRASLVPLIRRSLQFFFASSAYNEVDHIVLAGGVAMISGLGEMVNEYLGTPNTIANPFLNMAVSKRIDLTHLTADAPALMVCCGLALRSFV
ncbi:MAG: pilus assembly protein PilM [Legionellales bacterium]|nr:pilus assembly protein PilM [Legionellales bacterium]